jgi:predicted O-methyltransferase YrrM
MRKLIHLLKSFYLYYKRERAFKRKYWSKEYDSDEDARNDEYLTHSRISKDCKLGIVEIGVLYGETSKVLAESNPSIQVFGVDPMIPDSMNSDLIGNLNKIKENTKNCQNFTLIKDYSFNVIKEWDKPFDYIFIDGDHTYEATKKDYEDWFPKLATGGLISFHDSTMNRGNIRYWPGPSKLADDMIKNDKRVQFIESIGRLTIFKKY